jgi:hypothetical protein
MCYDPESLDETLPGLPHIQTKILNMDTLKVGKNEATKAYQSADEAGKELLLQLFGKSIVPESITDKVKTFDDACKVLGIDPVKAICTPPKHCLANEARAMVAYGKLLLICRALNDGWSPDWDNDNEYKWYPWFYMNKPGFRLGSVLCGYAGSVVGSRLCFSSEELARYAAKQFEDLYRDFIG